MFGTRLTILSLSITISVLSNLTCLLAQLDQNTEKKDILGIAKKIAAGNRSKIEGKYNYQASNETSNRENQYSFVIDGDDDRSNAQETNEEIRMDYQAFGYFSNESFPKINDNQKIIISNQKNGDYLPSTDNFFELNSHAICTSNDCRQKRQITKFQCATGENSIPTTFVCDGTANCGDGSDENIAACRIKYPTYCLLPTYANNISIMSCKNPIKSSEGDLVDQFTLLSISSKANGGSSDDLQLICIDGTWISPLAGRNQKCNELPTAGSNVKEMYYKNGREVNAHNAHFAGTVIYSRCTDKGIREKRFPNAKESTCGEDGKWSVERFYCYDVSEKCNGLPMTGDEVTIYYEDGSKADPNNLHIIGTIIYPQCKSESETYPNVKEATCDENGRWSVDRFDCHTCSYSPYPENLSFPLVEVTSSRLSVICRAHFVSPYVIMTAASCFNESSTSEYYVYLDREEKTGDLVNPSKLVKIKKIYYEKSQDKHHNYVRLARVNSRLTLSNDRSFVCLDWKNNFPTDLQPDDKGWITPTTIGEHSHLEAQNYSWKSCNGSSYPSKNSFTTYEACVDLDHKKYNMRKGAGFYMSHKGVDYLRAIAINATQTLRYTATYIGTSQFWLRIKNIITLTNRDYPNINATTPQIAETFINNETISFQNVNTRCSKGKTYVKFANGCLLPEKKNLDYRVDCSGTEFKEFCNIVTNDYIFNVPEGSILRRVECSDGYASSSSSTSSSVCLRGTWLPPISRCEP